jgi:hypothetical protein
VFACATPSVSANDRRGGDDHRATVVPAVKLAGNSGGELLGDWYFHNLSLPADRSPFGGSADLCLDLGRHGKVLSPAGGIDRGGFIEMSCTVKVGRPVLLVETSADCSSAEEPPFFGANAFEQRRCALDFLRGLDITSITVSVDGAPTVDIHAPRFLAVSPQRQVVFPPGAVFGAKEGPATYVAAGWIAEIRGMKKGQHVVRATLNIVLDDGPATFPFIVHFDVVGGGRHDD